MRWSATKTSPTIAHGVFFLYYIRVKRGGFWSERGQTTTRFNTFRKNKQLWSAAHMYILKNVGGHIILHSAVFGNQSLKVFWPCWVWSHFIQEKIFQHCMWESLLSEVQALQFDAAMNHPTHLLHPWYQASGDGHFPRPPDDTPLTIDSSGAYFRGESQVKVHERLKRESHPRCKQNRYSNETGILNPWHSVKCLQHWTIPSKQQRDRTSKCFHWGNPRIAMFCDYHRCFSV